MDISCTRVLKKKRVEICDEELASNPRFTAKIAGLSAAHAFKVQSLSNGNLGRPTKNGESASASGKAPVPIPQWKRQLKLERVCALDHEQASSSTKVVCSAVKSSPPTSVEPVMVDDSTTECHAKSHSPVQATRTVPAVVVHPSKSHSPFPAMQTGPAVVVNSSKSYSPVQATRTEPAVVVNSSKSHSPFPAMRTEPAVIVNSTKSHSFVPTTRTEPAVMVVDDATIEYHMEAPRVSKAKEMVGSEVAKKQREAKAKPKPAPSSSSYLSRESRTASASSSKPKAQAKSSGFRTTSTLQPSAMLGIPVTCGLQGDLGTAPGLNRHVDARNDVTEAPQPSAQHRTPIPKIVWRTPDSNRHTELYPGRKIVHGVSNRGRHDPVQDRSDKSMSKSPRETSGDDAKQKNENLKKRASGGYSVVKARQNVLKHKQKVEEEKTRAETKRREEEKLKRDNQRVSAPHVFAGWYSDKQARCNVISAKKREEDEKQMALHKARAKSECLKRLARMAKAYTPMAAKTDHRPVSESPRPPFRPASRAMPVSGKRAPRRSDAVVTLNGARRRTSRRQTRVREGCARQTNTRRCAPVEQKEKPSARAQKQTPTERPESRRSRSLPPRSQPEHTTPHLRLGYRPPLRAQHQTEPMNGRAVSCDPKKNLARQQRLRTKDLLRELRQPSKSDTGAYFAELAEKFSTTNGPIASVHPPHEANAPDAHAVTEPRETRETEVARVHAAATIIQKHVRRLLCNRNLAQYWMQMQTTFTSERFEWPTMSNHTDARTMNAMNWPEPERNDRQHRIHNWDAQRPPSRGGESWQPLGQTSPPAYEQVTPEQFEQFQYICSPRDASNHGSDRANDYDISVMDVVRRRENFLAVETRAVEETIERDSVSDAVPQDASESVWSPAVSIVESNDYSVKESDDGSLKERLLAALKPEPMSASADSIEFRDLFEQPVIEMSSRNASEPPTRDISKPCDWSGVSLPRPVDRPKSPVLERLPTSPRLDRLPKSPGALDMEFAESLHVLESAEQGLSMAQDLQNRALIEQSQRQQLIVNQARQEEDRREIYLQSERQMRVAMEEADARQRLVSENLADSLAQGVFAAQSDLQLAHQSAMEKVSERDRANAEALREERAKLGRQEKCHQEREEILSLREAKIQEREERAREAKMQEREERAREAKMQEREQRAREAQEQNLEAARRSEQRRWFADDYSKRPMDDRGCSHAQQTDQSDEKADRRRHVQAILTRHDRSSSDVSLGSNAVPDKLENQLLNALGPHTHKTVRRLIPSLPSSWQESAPSSARSLVSSSDDRSILSSRGGDQFARFSHDLARRMANNELQRAGVEEKMFRIQQKNVDRALSARIQRLHERQRQSKTPKGEKWIDRRVRKVTMLAQEEHKVLEMQRQQVQKKLRVPDLAGIISLNGTLLGSMKRETSKELISPRIPDDEETIDMLLLNLARTLPKVSSVDEARDTKKEVSRLYRKKQKLLSEKLHTEILEREKGAAQRLANKALAFRIDDEVIKRHEEVKAGEETSVEEVAKSISSGLLVAMSGEVYESNFEIAESSLDLTGFGSQKDVCVQSASPEPSEQDEYASSRADLDSSPTRFDQYDKQDSQLLSVGVSESIHESILDASVRSKEPDARSASSGKIVSVDRPMSEERASMFDSGDYGKEEIGMESASQILESIEVVDGIDLHSDVESRKLSPGPRVPDSTQDDGDDSPIVIEAEREPERVSPTKSEPNILGSRHEDDAEKKGDDEYSMSFEGSVEEEILSDVEKSSAPLEPVSDHETKLDSADRRLEGISLFRDRVNTPAKGLGISLGDDISLGESEDFGIGILERIALGDEDEKSSSSDRAAISPSLQQPQSVLAASALLDLDSALRDNEDKEEKVPLSTIPRPPSPPPSPHNEEVTDKIVEDIVKTLFNEIWDEIKEDTAPCTAEPIVAVDCGLTSVGRFLDLVMEFHGIADEEKPLSTKHILEGTGGENFILGRLYQLDELTVDQVSDVESWVSLLSDSYDYLVKNLKAMHLENMTWTRWKTGFGVSPLQKYREATCPPATMRCVREKLMEEMRPGDSTEYDGELGSLPYMSEPKLDELLSREIRSDEKSWLDVEKDAVAMKNLISARIFDELCLELAHEMLDMCEDDEG